MSELPRSIERSQLVPLSVEDAFAFFADAYNLEALTPPWLRFRILTPRPIPMEKGTTIDYVLTTHRLPVRWRTEIVEWGPGRRGRLNGGAGSGYVHAARSARRPSPPITSKYVGSPSFAEAARSTIRIARPGRLLDRTS